MTQVELLTIAVPANIAADLRAAVSRGDYASPAEVVGAVLRDWTRRARELDPTARLSADIAIGLADLTSSKIAPFDAARMVQRGRETSKQR